MSTNKDIDPEEGGTLYVITQTNFRSVWMSILIAVVALLAQNLFGVVYAQPQTAFPGLRGDVLVDSTTRTIQALPGEAVNLVATVKNDGSETTYLHTDVIAPSGWRLIIPPDSFLVLEPGDQQAVIFAVVVPRSFGTGAYPVGFVVRDERGHFQSTLEYTVDVRVFSDILVQPRLGPDIVRQDEYAIEYWVQNLGNSTDTFQFRVSDNLNSQLEVEPDRATLAAGEGTIVTVRASSITSSITRSRLHSVTLSAQSVTQPDTFGHGTHTAEIIPGSLSPLAAYHHFPLNLRLRWVDGVDENRISWQLYGQGPVTDTDPGRLRVNFREGFQFVEYRNAEWRVAGGHQRFTLSPLLRSGTVDLRGVEIEHFGTPWNGQVFVHEESDKPSTLGARLTHVLDDNVDVSVNAVHVTSDDETVMSVRSRFLLTDKWEMDAEYGWDTSSFSQGALRLHGTYIGDDTSGSIRLLQRNQGFEGASAANRTITGLLSQPIGINRLVTRAQVTERFTEDLASPRRSLAFDVNTTLSGTYDNHRWSTRYGISSRALTGDPFKLRHRLDAWINSRLQERESLYHRLSVRAGGDSPSSIGYGIRYGFPTLDGTGNLFGSIQGVEDEQTRIGLGASYHQYLSGVSLSIGAEAVDIANEKYRAFGSLSVRDGQSGATLALSASSNWSVGVEPEYRASATLTVPFSIAITRRSDIGSVSGRIVDINDEPVAGVVVDLNGLSVVTDESGLYQFPAVPAGQYELNVRPMSLPANAVTDPLTPFTIEVKVHAETRTRLVVMQGGSMSGHIRVADIPAEVFARRDLIFPEPIRALGGLKVIFTNEEGQRLEAITDANGRFARDRILPGRWNVSLDTGMVPSFYRLLTTEVIITPGAEIIGDIVLEPVPRQIRFVDEGVIEAGQ